MVRSFFMSCFCGLGESASSEDQADEHLAERL